MAEKTKGIELYTSSFNCQEACFAVPLVRDIVTMHWYEKMSPVSWKGVQGLSAEFGKNSTLSIFKLYAGIHPVARRPEGIRP
jgi:hypothetical protein